MFSTLESLTTPLRTEIGVGCNEAMTMNRRRFLKTGFEITIDSLFAEALIAGAEPEHSGKPVSPISANDRIQFALIGAGGQGQGDARIVQRVPGVRLVAVADCYDGRLAHCREIWGNDIFTTRNYHEILSRSDVDAVIIATPDHWHKQAAVDAMNAGKDVYLEKPMIHLYSDGPEIIQTALKTKRILQVGSQRVSSVLYKKAKSLVAAGAIGKISVINAWWDRNPDYPVAAFVGSIPPDASIETIDWLRFLGSAPKEPFNAEHFFQWRKWKAFGSGVAGDLFVHLFSGTHFIMDSHGPTKAVAMGGIRHWKDGRDQPDVLLGLFDFPQGFNLHVRVNFVSGARESEGFQFVGSEGTMQVSGQSVVIRRSAHPIKPDYNIGSWSESTQSKFLSKFQQQYPAIPPHDELAIEGEEYAVPSGYSDSYDHLRNFCESVRSRRPAVEDAVFGFRAAGAALLANESYEKGTIIRWDPTAMRIQ